jgi:hypothetical protein
VPSNVSFSLIYAVLNYDIFDTPGYEYLGPSTPVPNVTAGTFSGAANGTIHIPFYIDFPYAIANPGGPDDSTIVFEGEIIATRVATLAGDYNQNNKVDAADYIVWRKNETANNALPNDNGSTTQAARFSLWQANFGSPGTGGGAGLNNSILSVPEPNYLQIGSVGLFCFAFLVLRCRPARTYDRRFESAR